MVGQYQRYFVHLALNGLPLDTFPPFEVPQVEYERLNRYIEYRMSEQSLKHDPAAYIWFRTAAGIDILASEDDLDMFRFFTELSSDPSPQPPVVKWFDEDVEIEDEEDGDDDEIENRGRLELYLRGRREPIISSTMDEPDEIGMN